MPPRFVPPTSPKCPRCSKSVYSAEQVIGPNGAAWHKSCFTCRECNRRLDSNTLAEHEGEAYCKTCHKKMWGPTGYGYASGLLVREDPESQFKQSIGRPVNSGGTSDLINQNTGGSNSAAEDQGSYYSPGHVQEETEEQRRERLVPVNATLKKRNSLDFIREQAEASRRAYDEAHAQRVTNRFGKVETNITGGSNTSNGSRGDQKSNNNSGYLSATGSDSSSAFGSAIATTSSPAPSFSSISSATSSQPATLSLYLNQSIRSTSSGQQESQDAESEFARSRQALSFQTGAPSTSFNSAPAEQPPLPKREPEPKAVVPSSQATSKDLDDSYLDYVPIRIVARNGDSQGSSSSPATIPAPAVNEDEWDAEPAPKKPAVTTEQPIYLSQHLKQQQQQQQQQQKQEREYISSVPSSSSSGRINDLINETDRLNLREYEERQQQAKTSSAVATDEWDEEPTPTVPSRSQNLNYAPARHVSSAATRTWVPTQNTSSESYSSNSHSRTTSSEAQTSPVRNPSGSTTFNSTPSTTYYRSGGIMTPKKVSTFGGGGDICPRCQKTVYHAESALAPGGSKYHKLCLRCVECSKSLDSTNMTDRQGAPYCKTCYGKAFGAKGYGYGSGSSMLHTEL